MSKKNNIDNTAELDEAQVQKILSDIPAEAQEEQYIEVGVRPWGVYYVLEDKAQYKVKKIVVQPGHRLSLQSHQHRSEHWIVVSGTAHVEIHTPDTEDFEYCITPNQSCYIPMNSKHRLANKGKIPLVLVEVQVGEYTGEDDIERFEDDYKRV